MTDIVERLRTGKSGYTTCMVTPTHREAANEIERLRSALRRALHLHDIEQAERSTPNVPAWVEDARALLEDGRC